LSLDVRLRLRRYQFCPLVEHRRDVGIQSEFEPEPAPELIPVEKPITVNMGLQTLPVLRTEIGTQCDTTQPRAMSPIRISSGVGTDALDDEPRGVGVGKGLPSIITSAFGGYQNRRSDSYAGR